MVIAFCVSWALLWAEFYNIERERERGASKERTILKKKQRRRKRSRKDGDDDIFCWYSMTTMNIYSFLPQSSSSSSPSPTAYFYVFLFWISHFPAFLHFLILQNRVSIKSMYLWSLSLSLSSVFITVLKEKRRFRILPCHYCQKCNNQLLIHMLIFIFYHIG